MTRTHTSSSSQAEVLLISMPFVPLFSPSLGLSLLKSALRDRGVSASIKYLSFSFAQLIGVDLYCRISDGFPAVEDLTGEWLFSHALFPQTEADVSGYIHDVLRGDVPDHKRNKANAPVLNKFISELLDARRQVNNFIRQSAHLILEASPQIVGFTSVFQQQLASLAVAKYLKSVRPDIYIVFGGANCEGVMGSEICRQFPFVDAVVSGEGEAAFTLLVEEVLNRRPATTIPGVIRPQSRKLRVLVNDDSSENTVAAAVADMDGLPYPDFDDFFEQAECFPWATERIHLLFETSRGCWWGERHHCTFCGLNGNAMTFRRKSPNRVVSELTWLLDRYGCSEIAVVDNILDMGYFNSVLPRLAELDLPLSLFYEVKANLKREHIRKLRDAKITTIQPGIESLSNEVLRLMRKGVTALQNIQLLKWCKEYGIHADWNLLWGFPNEDPHDYERMAQIIPLLTHLQPPLGLSQIRLDRFSPNFTESAELGLSDVKPFKSYSYVYRLSESAVYNLSYFFSFTYNDARARTKDYVSVLQKEVLDWKRCYDETDLFSIDKGDHLLVWDFRPVASQHLYILDGVQREALLACAEAPSLERLSADLKANRCRSNIKEIERALQALILAKLIISQDNRFLSLVIPVGEYSPNPTVLSRLLDAASSMSIDDSQRVA